MSAADERLDAMVADSPLPAKSPDPMAGRVVKRKLVTASGSTMQVGCIHTTTAGTACGGCFARLWLLVQDLTKAIEERRLSYAAGLIAKSAALSRLDSEAQKRFVAVKRDPNPRVCDVCKKPFPDNYRLIVPEGYACTPCKFRLGAEQNRKLRKRPAAAPAGGGR